MEEESETIKPKEGAALSEAMEAFKKEFSVNPWSLMENAIKESQGNYGGDVQLRWEVQGNTAGSVPVMELTFRKLLFLMAQSDNRKQFLVSSTGCAFKIIGIVL